jgi:hypothetical protein
VIALAPNAWRGVAPSSRPSPGEGARDRLTDFLRPVSRAYYFAPSLDVLNELAGPDVDR